MVYLAALLLGLCGFIFMKSAFVLLQSKQKKEDPIKRFNRRLTNYISTRKPGFTVRKLTKKERIETMILQSGLSSRYRIDQVLSYKQVGLYIWEIVLFIMLLKGVPWGDFFFFGIVSFAFAMFWPELYFKQVLARSQRKARQEFLNIVEYLRLYVEAGLNLEMAWRHLAKNLKGVWAEEWKRVVRALDRGVRFEDAVNELAVRFDSQDLKRFLLAVKQARLLGASMNQTLAIQGQMMRTRRRQDAEERAKTAAVKIAIPLVFFIFPSLLILFLGPPILKLILGV